MEYSNFKPLTKDVSRFIVGTMNIFAKDDNSDDFARLDAALDMGLNTFDTAMGYGRGSTEVALGKYFKDRQNRNDIFLISKGCHPNPYRTRVNPFDLSADLHDSLAKLGTDHIDLYLLHRDERTTPVSDLMDTLYKHYTEGKILSYGVSNWEIDRIEEANAYARANNMPELIVSSPNYSLAQQYSLPFAPGSVTISGPENKAARDWYTKTQMPVLAYSSMAGGFFSGRITKELYNADPSNNDFASAKPYCGEENFIRLERAARLAKEKGVTIPQIAIAFVLDSPMNVFPIIGAANKAEIASSVQALDIKLTANEVAYLDLEIDSL